MQLTIMQIHTTPQTITITKKEYNELKHKATKYDALSRTHSDFITAYNSKLTPAQRSANAKKAAKARWGKTNLPPKRSTMKTNEEDIKDSILNLYGEPTIHEN